MSCVDLDAELVAAMECIRPRGGGYRLLPQFERFGFSWKFSAWGIGRVRFDRHGLYEPDPDAGERAWIVGVVDCGELIDLAAFRATDHRPATRCGVGLALGVDLLERNRWHAIDGERPVTRLFPDVLDWLRDPVGGVHVFDLRRAREMRLFDPRDTLDCVTAEYRQRVRRALEVPNKLPRLLPVSSPLGQPSPREITA
jgi:hypothetical protein